MLNLLTTSILAASLAWGLQNPIDDDARWVNLTQPLRRAGIPLDDQASLINALHRLDRPSLAASAAHALARLPKSHRVIEELNRAAFSDDDFLMSAAIDTLAGFGDRQWVEAARARLPHMRQKVLRLDVAGRLAQEGVYDGWEIVEFSIMEEEPVYRDIALARVYYFRDRKDAFGLPMDLVQKLEEMKSRASSEAVRDALAAKITQCKQLRNAEAAPKKQ